MAAVKVIWRAGNLAVRYKAMQLITAQGKAHIGQNCGFVVVWSDEPGHYLLYSGNEEGLAEWLTENEARFA